MICTFIILFLIVFNLGINAAKHGQPKDDTYNFWYNLIATIIVLLLYWGAGLFDKFGL